MEQQHTHQPVYDGSLDTATGVINGVVLSLAVLWPAIVVAAIYTLTHNS